MLNHMKPRKVCVHGWCSRERLLEPCVIPSGKTSNREPAHFVELVQVIVERLATEPVTRLGAEAERRFPRRLFLGGGPPLLERESLISAFRRSEVSEQRANRVAGLVVQMIKFRNT